MTRDLIYQDEAGNKLFRDVDKRLIVVNNQGFMVKKEDVKRFISRPTVKLAIKRYFGEVPKIKILSSYQTRRLNRRRKPEEPEFGFAKFNHW